MLEFRCRSEHVRVRYNKRSKGTGGMKMLSVIREGRDGLMVMAVTTPMGHQREREGGGEMGETLSHISDSNPTHTHK